MIKKRLFGPRKIVIAMKFGEGFIADPSIAIGLSNIKSYWDDYFDMKHIVLKKDEEAPTYFTIQGLERLQCEYALQYHDNELGSRSKDMSDMALWYIRCGLKGIENYKINKDGKDELINSIETTKNDKYGEMLSDGFLDKMNFDNQEKLALFSMIRHLSEASSPLLVASNKPSGPTQ